VHISCTQLYCICFIRVLDGGCLEIAPCFAVTGRVAKKVENHWFRESTQTVVSNTSCGHTTSLTKTENHSNWGTANFMERGDESSKHFFVSLACSAKNRWPPLRGWQLRSQFWLLGVFFCSTSLSFCLLQDILINPGELCWVGIPLHVVETNWKLCVCRELTRSLLAVLCCHHFSMIWISAINIH